MTILGTINKQEREVIDYFISYSTKLATGTGVTIASGTYEVAPSGVTTTLTVVDTGTRIKLVLAGGTSGKQYKITILATRSDGLIYEDELYLTVENE